MSKEKKSQETKISDENKKDEINEMSDQDLEQAAGGFFTILDTCKFKYDRGTCYRLDGLMKCSQLDAMECGKVSVNEFEGYYPFIMSCRKGYFTGVSEQINWQRSGF